MIVLAERAEDMGGDWLVHRRKRRYRQKGRRSTEDTVGLLLDAGHRTQKKRKKPGVTSPATDIVSFAVLPIALCFFLYPMASR